MFCYFRLLDSNLLILSCVLLLLGLEPFSLFIFVANLRKFIIFSYCIFCVNEISSLTRFTVCKGFDLNLSFPSCTAWTLQRISYWMLYLLFSGFLRLENTFLKDFICVKEVKKNFLSSLLRANGSHSVFFNSSCFSYLKKKTFYTLLEQVPILNKTNCPVTMSYFVILCKCI